MLSVTSASILILHINISSSEFSIFFGISSFFICLTPVISPLKELKKNSVIHERYEIIDFLLNLATKDETFSKKENNFIDKVSKELELNIHLM